VGSVTFNRILQVALEKSQRLQQDQAALTGE
jgi:hypothetical protein